MILLGRWNKKPYSIKLNQRCSESLCWNSTTAVIKCDNHPIFFYYQASNEITARTTSKSSGFCLWARRPQPVQSPIKSRLCRCWMLTPESHQKHTTDVKAVIRPTGSALVINSLSRCQSLCFSFSGEKGPAGPKAVRRESLTDVMFWFYQQSRGQEVRKSIKMECDRKTGS